MPGYGIPRIKYEIQSDEDDDAAGYQNTQFQQECHGSASAAETDPVDHFQDKQVPCDHENVAKNLLQNLQSPPALEELAPAAPAATPVCVKSEPEMATTTLATLHSAAQGSSMEMRRHLMLDAAEMTSEFMPLLPVKDESLSEGEQVHLSGSDTSDSLEPRRSPGATGNWSPQDMDLALEALRTQNMSLTKASSTYGIPSTTLWQRARRAGIDTPKREAGARAWRDHDLKAALQALRDGSISANKASKAYGIPSSTLYKIARREGIRLAAPFNAAPTAWRRADLRRALDAVRRGGSVQRAAADHNIPTGTLYGRCKREGIELSRSSPAPWSEDAMGEALEAVRVGQMSINQAAIHYNLPYSSLYGRFKRCKYQPQSPQTASLHQTHNQEHQEIDPQPPTEHYYHFHQNDPSHQTHQGYLPSDSTTQMQYPFLQGVNHSGEMGEEGYTDYYNQNIANVIVTS